MNTSETLSLFFLVIVPVLTIVIIILDHYLVSRTMKLKSKCMKGDGLGCHCDICRRDESNHSKKGVHHHIAYHSADRRWYS